MFRIFTFMTLIMSVYLKGYGQHNQAGEEDTPVFYERINGDDSLRNVLHNLGTFEGHFRTFFMSTINEGSNPDYFALGMGGGLAYYSPIIKNFQIGLSGFIIYNLASSDLTTRNGFSNRYEVGLFDVADPANRSDLDRLENLYLRYYFNSRQESFLQVGKFHIRTPLINLQDGRMRPNLQEGLWFEFRDWEKVKMTAGWLWDTSPRSTVEWYGIGESIGLYANGKAVNGKPASYFGHIESNQILIGNLEWSPLQNVNYQIWNYYVDNLFNTTLQKLELKKKYHDKTWTAGFQYMWQKSISVGELPVENQYISPDEQSHVFSSRIGFTNNRNANGWSLNYTRITSHGRFLFPREWGIEPLYTFMHRERNEGAGDVHALMLEHSRHVDKDRHLSIRGRAGAYSMPAVGNAALNKYAIPSYYQLSLEGNYKFKGFLHGFETQMLYTYKGDLDIEAEYQPTLTHNKTNLHHISLSLNYYF